MNCFPHDQLWFLLKSCTQPQQCISCASHSPAWIHPPCKSSNKSNHMKSHYHMKRVKTYYHRPLFTGTRKQHSSKNREPRKGGHVLDERNLTTASSHSGTHAVDLSSPTSTGTSAQAADSASSAVLLRLNARSLKKNRALKKKVSQLQRQVAKLQHHGNLDDLEKLESLAKDHKDVLLRLIKLEKEKKTLETLVKSLKQKEESSQPSVTNRAVQVETATELNSATQSLQTTPPTGHKLQPEAREDEAMHTPLQSHQTINDTGVQCALLTWEMRRASWELEKEEAEQLLLDRQRENIAEIKNLYNDVIERYSDRYKELVRCHEAKESSLEAQICNLNSELDKMRRNLAEVKNGTNDSRKNARNSEPSSAPTPLTVEHLSGLLKEWLLTANSRDTKIDSIRESVEQSLNKMLQTLQQENSSAAELRLAKQTLESLKEENSRLSVKFNTEVEAKVELQEQLLRNERKCSEMEAERHLHRMKEELTEERERENVLLRRTRDKLLAEVDAAKTELSEANAELTSLRSSKSKLERELREQQSVVDALKEQLEERITENCSLNTRLEERSVQLKKAGASLSELREKYSALDAEHNSSISGLKESVRQLTAAKDTMTQSHENEVRQLKMEIEQMRVRNETFQRQLAAITSTYHHMFGATDGSDNNSA